MPADPDGGRAGAVPVLAPGSPAGTLNLTPKALLLIGKELHFIQELASFIPRRAPPSGWCISTVCSRPR